MKNEDLIKKLEKFPKDADVVIYINSQYCSLDINIDEKFEFNCIELHPSNKSVPTDYDNFIDGGNPKDGLYQCNRCDKLYSKKELNEIELKNPISLTIKCTYCKKGNIKTVKQGGGLRD